MTQPTPTVPRHFVPALFVCVFLPAYGTHGLSPVLPELERELALHGQAMPTLLSSLFSVGSTVAYLTIGPLSDRIGRVQLLLAGIAAFAAVHFVSPFFITPIALAVLRFAAGLAGGTMFVMANALVVDYTPYTLRGRSMSFVWLGMPAAFVIGVPLSAYLAPLSWGAGRPLGARGYFVVAGLAAVAALGFVHRVFADARKRPAAVAHRGEEPAFVRRLLARPTLCFAALSSFVVTVAVFLLFPILASHSERTFGFDAPQRANLWLLLGLSGVLGGWLSGLIADRLGKKNCVIAALLISGACICLLPQAGLHVFLVLAFVVSTLVTLRQGPYQAIVTELVPPTERGSYLAVTLTSASLGTGLGQMLAGQLFDRVGFSGVAILSGVLLATAAACFALVPEPVPA